MKIEAESTDRYLVTVSPGELRLINNCINDAMDLMEDAEFQTRTGGFKDDARTLLKTIQAALRPRPA